MGGSHYVDSMANDLVAIVSLGKKVYGLRKVWGEEDIDRVLMWCWKYAEIESGHLQLNVGCNNKEYMHRLANLARERTTETVNNLIDMTNLARTELSKRLERSVDYDELKDVMEGMKLKFNFICADNYEALIHERHYKTSFKKIKLAEIFR